jgi:hypothetical protein
MNFDLRSRAVAEFLRTAYLLMAIVGSGIMGERLAGGNVAIALLRFPREQSWWCLF